MVLQRQSSPGLAWTLQMAGTWGWRELGSGSLRVPWGWQHLQGADLTGQSPGGGAAAWGCLEEPPPSHSSPVLDSPPPWAAPTTVAIVLPGSGAGSRRNPGKGEPCVVGGPEFRQEVRLQLLLGKTHHIAVC